MALRFQPPPFDPSQYQYQGMSQLGQGLGTGISTAFDRIVQGLMMGRQRQREIPATMLHFAQAGVSPTQIPGMEGPGLFGQYQAFSKQMEDVARMHREKMQAQTDLTKQNAAMMGRFAGGEGGALPNVVTDPGTGLQFISQLQLKGPPKFTQVQGQQLSPEGAKNISNADSGLRTIEKVRSILKSPEGKKAILKAGGAGATLFSVGDTTSQKLKTALNEASDVLARLRTGAQINEQELRYYNSLLSNRYRTFEGNMDALETIETFMKQLKSDLSTGKRVVGQVDNAEPLIVPQGQSDKKKTSPDKDPLGLFK